MSRLRSLLLNKIRRAPGGEPPIVAVAMANNPEVIGSIARALDEGLARFVLVGPRREIEAVAQEEGADVSTAAFRETGDPAEACGIAADLAASGEAQVVMKGLVQTADFVRALLSKERGLIGAGGLLSHVAVFDIPDYPQLLFMTDAAITTTPDVEQKVQLLHNVVGVARGLGVQAPRVACVCPVEKVSPKVPSTVDAAEIVRRAGAGELGSAITSAETWRRDGSGQAVRGDGPGGPAEAGVARDRATAGVGGTAAIVDGPFGLDVAISPESAGIKGIPGPVAGHADVLLMPGIDSGNVFYKALTGFVKPRLGAIVAGARIPAVLTSRADSEETKYDSLLLAVALGAGR